MSVDDVPQVVRDRFEFEKTEPSDIQEHLQHFVNTALRLNATKVIELGVRHGVSTAAWLYAAHRIDGHVWSVDTADCGLNADERWTFLLGDDRDPNIVAQLPKDADIVFIDTSHHYDHTLTELDIYSQRVRPGGVIFLHDTELEHPEGASDMAFPVKRAVETFCGENGWEWENRDNCYGLATVFVP